MCPFCRKEEEELDHILIHCHTIWGQWTNLLFAFGVDWTCHFLEKDLIQSWMHFPVRKKGKAIWRATPPYFYSGLSGKRGTLLFLKMLFFPRWDHCLRGLVLFQRWISNLLDCSCLGSMAMPRVWFFWVGLFVSSFFLPLSFCLALCGISCICLVYSLFFCQYTTHYRKKKVLIKNIHS